jgi:membrane-associated protein
VSSLDPHHLLQTFGTLGLLAIIFAESGLLLGLVFPGDSLLFTAGLLAASHRFGLNIWVIVIGCFLAALLGAVVGYTIGARLGPSLFRRPDSRFFKHEYVEQSRVFFEHHGPKAVVIGRFVPFVRTLVPMLAGMGQMRYRTFLWFSALGALLWAVGVTVAGYFLGKTVPNIDHYLLPIIALIVLVSLIGPFLEWRRHRARGAEQLTEAQADAEAEELHELFED